MPATAVSNKEPLPKAYDPGAVERKWYRKWLKHELFYGNPLSNKPIYSIVLPPPNVTSILHIGHTLNHTLPDILIRWKKLEGYETEWLPGVDHAGIATQVQVEKDLAKENLTPQRLGREKFLERIWDWKKRYGDVILEQIQQEGCACDWKRTRFTLDEGLSRAVIEVFVRLYEKGLIYKGKYIINWCVRCHTSLSDDETERQPIDSYLWYIRYQLESGQEFLIIATTRPETMLADTAIAVNPGDSRYQHLVGKTAILPIIGRRLPIIADEFVDPEFGTGILKVTPAHDPNDFEIGRRHKLEEVNIFNPDGTLNENAGKYQGLDRHTALNKVVEELKQCGLLEKIEPYKLSATVCYRCQQIIEPLISDQWFVKMKPLAQPAAQVVRDGKIRFHPEHWAKVYLHWMDTIHDWCISRQLWWGHRIPAWYCQKCGKINVARTRPEKCEKCDSTHLLQDEDVLDTWFSSWLWPFSTFGWPEKTVELEKFYPTKTLLTDPGIIFLWVARMVMAGLEFMGEVPFTEVYIHGTVRDQFGVRMSKSLGNGIDPLDIIRDYGTDALRVSLVLATPEGQDPWISSSTFEIGRNFANKLWNATRFVLLHLKDFDPTLADWSRIKPAGVSLPERWLLSRLTEAITTVTNLLERFRYNGAAKALYDFAWHDFCDWYLEFSKISLQSKNLEQCQATLTVLYRALNDLLILLHPFMPFVTEELWHKLNGIAENEVFDSILLCSWPKPELKFLDEKLEGEMVWFQELVIAIRNLRSELEVPPARRTNLIVRVDTDQRLNFLRQQESYLAELGHANQITISRQAQKPAHAVSAIISGAEIYLPLEGLIDLASERTRLLKSKEKYAELLEQTEAKLKNPAFVERAPRDVVEKEKAKRDDYRARIQKLNLHLAELETTICGHD